MSEPEAGFDPHAAVSNVTAATTLQQPAFRGPLGAESEPGAEGAPEAAVQPESFAAEAAEEAAEGPESGLLDIGVASFGPSGGAGIISLLAFRQDDQGIRTPSYAHELHGLESSPIRRSE